jgi:hypothetical protein
MIIEFYCLVRIATRNGKISNGGVNVLANRFNKKETFNLKVSFIMFAFYLLVCFDRERERF